MSVLHVFFKLGHFSIWILYAWVCYWKRIICMFCLLVASSNETKSWPRRIHNAPIVTNRIVLRNLLLNFEWMIEGLTHHCQLLIESVAYLSILASSGPIDPTSMICRVFVNGEMLLLVQMMKVLVMYCQTELWLKLVETCLNFLQLSLLYVYNPFGELWVNHIFLLW